MSNSMINPPIAELLKMAENRFTLVTITAKRARQLIQGDKPLIDIDSTKPVTVAINEISQRQITYKTVKEGIK